MCQVELLGKVKSPTIQFRCYGNSFHLLNMVAMATNTHCHSNGNGWLDSLPFQQAQLDTFKPIFVEMADISVKIHVIVFFSFFGLAV